MGDVCIIQGDNLQTLRELRDQGARFDLVELDGPYMAGLEEWDNLSEAEYIQHYAERLTMVRDVLQPWGVVFVFGYPEGCAEIKSWAHRTETLYLRRWLTWYKQRTQQKGRKVENILFFLRDVPKRDKFVQFGSMLRTAREKHGWTLETVGKLARKQWWHRGGNLYFETCSGDYPSIDDFVSLSKIFGFNPWEWTSVIGGSYDWLTEYDYFSNFYSEDTATLNGNGLRSKPVQLYLDLFKPTMPPTDDKRAMILYGGSGNAGIAAAALGYDVTICETDPERCELIRNRWEKEVNKWREKQAQLDMFSLAPTQAQLWKE